MPHVSNKTGICAQASTPSLSCSLEWLCFRSSLVWCKNPKNNEFRTKKFPNQEFLYGISSFCTLSENNSFLHGKISCFCIFLVKNRILNTEPYAMSFTNFLFLFIISQIHQNSMDNSAQACYDAAQNDQSDIDILYTLILPRTPG